MAPVKISQEKTPDRILGKKANGYTCNELRRILQTYECPWHKYDKKRDLQVKVAKLEREKNLKVKDRFGVLRGILADEYPWRFQELNDDQSFKDSAYPSGWHKINADALAKSLMKQGFNPAEGFAVEGEVLQECTSCKKLLGELHFPSTISVKCSHSVDLCRHCLASHIRAKVEAGSSQPIRCPSCQVGLASTEVKPLVTAETWAMYSKLKPDVADHYRTPQNSPPVQLKKTSSTF